MDNIDASLNTLSPLPLYWKALEKNMPGQLLASSLFVDDNFLYIDGNEISIEANINILAYGKASRLMYEAAKKIIGPVHFGQGLLITHENITHVLLDSSREEVLKSSHPFISELSAIAGKQVKKFVQKSQNLDILLVLVSGGGSAMVAHPIQEINLADKIEFISDVMHASVPEREVNILKKALSQIKGGKLAQLSTSKIIVNCILSDERNHEISAISSGMTVCNELINPIDIMDEYSLWSLANKKVTNAIRKHGEQRNIGCDKKIINSIIGSRENLINGIKELANEYGYKTVHIVDTLHSCSPLDAVSILAEEFQKYYEGSERGKHLVVSTGEVQVKVDTKKPNKGGRNQHLVALFMLNFCPAYDFFLCAIASDGMDYLEGVHGAFFNKEMMNLVSENNAFIASSLNNSNSYDVHKLMNSLLEGPKTGTNMSDFFLCSFNKI